MSTLDVGKIAAIGGPCTAAADTVSITVHGRGGHGAFPHQTVDPSAVAVEVISNLQHIVSRNTSPPSVPSPITRATASSQLLVDRYLRLERWQCE